MKMNRCLQQTHYKWIHILIKLSCKPHSWLPQRSHFNCICLNCSNGKATLQYWWMFQLFTETRLPRVFRLHKMLSKQLWLYTFTIWMLWSKQFSKITSEDVIDANELLSIQINMTIKHLLLWYIFNNLSFCNYS